MLGLYTFTLGIPHTHKEAHSALKHGHVRLKAATAPCGPWLEQNTLCLD